MSYAVRKLSTYEPRQLLYTNLRGANWFDQLDVGTWYVHIFSSFTGRRLNSQVERQCTHLGDKASF